MVSARSMGAPAQRLGTHDTHISIYEKSIKFDPMADDNDNDSNNNDDGQRYHKTGSEATCTLQQPHMIGRL